MMEKQQKQKIKVIVCSAPLGGHYIPILRLAEALAQRPDFDVVFATSSHAFPRIKLSTNIKKLQLQDSTEDLVKQNKFQYIPVYYYEKPWNSQLESFIQKYQPTIIIAEYFAVAIIKIGQRLKIPTVVYVALKVQSLQHLDFPILKKNTSLFGLTVIYSNFLRFVVPKYAQPLVRIGKYIDNSLVLVTSFFGLQEAFSLPPNVKLIGFTFKKMNQLTKPNFEKELQDWLSSMKSLNKDIIYVTFGSVIKLSESFIKFLYDGLKKLNYAVIWSLSHGKLPQQNNQFFVRKWLPQLELLHSKQIKVVITHCGWGAVSQCLQTCKPMLCVPNFADQPRNAQLVQSKGIGLILRKLPSNHPRLPKMIQQPYFTHEQLQKKLNKLITDESYVQNLRKLKKLMQTETGGIQEAIKHIRNATKHGVSHLVDQDITKIRQRSLIPLLIFICIIIAGIFSLLNFTLFSSKDNSNL